MPRAGNYFAALARRAQFALADIRSESEPRGRLAGLDALRGIAALGVVLFHYDICFSFPLGRYGVDLFFAISGFVIFMTLERAANLRAFAVSRFARLYPAFWAALGLALAARALDGRLTLSLGDVLANATMLPLLFGAPFADGVYWTLFCELVFYGLAGLFFAAGGKRPEFACLGWMLVSIAALAYAPPIVFTAIDAPYSQWFVAGVMIYRLRREPRNFAALAVLATAIFVAAQIPFSPDIHAHGLASAAITAGCAIAVWGGARMRLQGRLGGVLLFFGEISYSLYLVHDQLGISLVDLGRTIGLPDAVSLAATFAIAVATAAAINKYVERPAQRWIQSKYYSRALRGGACAIMTAT